MHGAYDFHGDNLLLAALHPGARAALKPDLCLQPLKKGAILCEPGQPIDQIYFPSAGLVSYLGIGSRRESVEMTSAGMEGVVGAMAALGPCRASGRAVVRVAGEAIRVSAAALREAARDHPQLRALAFEASAAHLAQVERAVLCNTLHQVEPRLARWVLENADRLAGTLVPVTQEALSELLGVHRGTLNSMLRTFERTGQLGIRQRGVIAVRDRNRLLKTACSCYAVNLRTTERLVRQVREAA